VSALGTARNNPSQKQRRMPFVFTAAHPKHLNVPRYWFVLIRLVHERTRQKEKNAKTRLAQTRKIYRLILGFSMRTARHTLRNAIEAEHLRLCVGNMLRQGAKSHSISL